MANLPNPFASNGFPREDKIVIAGSASPGKATVKNLETASEWDIRKGYGFSGATVIYMGESLVKFLVEFEFWLDAQYAEWQAYAKRFFSKPTRSPVPGQVLALGIKHPLLNAEPYNVDKVVRTTVSGLEQDEYGLWTVSVGFLQYRPPQFFLSKPNGAIPSVAKVVPTARDAAEEKIQQLRAQRDALAGF